MMEYPTILLPKKEDSILNIEHCQNDCVFIRQAMESGTITDSSRRRVRLDAIIPPERKDLLTQLSMNLLGEFSIDFLKYEFIENTGYYTAKWVPGSNCLIPDDSHFVLDDSRKLPIFFQFDNSLPKEMPINSGNIGIICVAHIPCNSNYWHFQLSLYDVVKGLFFTNRYHKKWFRDIEDFLEAAILGSYAKPLLTEIQYVDISTSLREQSKVS